MLGGVTEYPVLKWIPGIAECYSKMGKLPDSSGSVATTGRANPRRLHERSNFSSETGIPWNLKAVFFPPLCARLSCIRAIFLTAFLSRYLPSFHFLILFLYWVSLINCMLVEDCYRRYRRYTKNSIVYSYFALNR